MIQRRRSRQIRIGKVTVGGDAPIRIQSMTNTKTTDIKATVTQISELTRAGCELIRVSVPDSQSVQAIKKIKEQIAIPLIADVHFNWRIAIEAMRAGADAIRINPGNIRNEEIEKIVVEAREREIPIRIGVNAGSLKQKYLQKYGHPTAKALVESALETVALFEKLDFYQTKVSVKASSVLNTIEAYRLIAKEVDYPLHIGVSEAGPLFSGVIRSSIGVGVLLSEGIGDTIRISLTADPLEEIKTAREILKALGLRKGIEIISCPTCARCEVNLIRLVSEIEQELSIYHEFSLKVAVMGCVVNGPGEAREADLGIAAGRGSGVLFRQGKVIKKVKEEEFVRELVSQVKKNDSYQK